MPLGLLYTHKCCLRSLKMELLGNSFQGRDIQKLCFQCLCPNGQKQRPPPTFISVCSNFSKYECGVCVMTLNTFVQCWNGCNIV